ncbi:hypothetical protein N657DRAFT_644799 [Parathielavia appendiculata]|uniref:Dol-P-Man:Man(5)GlcNAc(2)-PP-Dol alpha-1,3-mannosyltransferase n=1 Tax=Parathielavia appendiculata TaxID=2587402 RepID=A0AAN6U1P8_9PEZI|nr:hypothetical protein N657DRAFT_644799 [Parathielavia appendiculata]
MSAPAKESKKLETKLGPTDTSDMSKLSPSLKALINAPFARPGQTPAPQHIRDVYTRIAREARERKYGDRPWVTLSAAATFTLNSPASLLILHDLASSSSSKQSTVGSSTTTSKTTTLTALSTAELIREIGLKCISFNGIPRTINCLGAFRAGLAQHAWSSQLSTTPTRALTPENLSGVAHRGRALWKSIYTPLDEKLEARLADSHPDLPVHILGSHYGPLLADPPFPPPSSSSLEGGKQDTEGRRRGGGLASVGRNLTSVVAIACLRAQTGVGPQVLSHVFGLRKGVEQGLHWEEFGGEAEDGKEEAEGVERLAGDEGCEWLLRSVDAIAEAIGVGFARWEGDHGEREGVKAKL